DPVGDVSIAQSHDRRAEDGHSRGRQDEPSGERALANAAPRPIVVRIDGNDPGHARIVARRQHQRDRPADRYADNNQYPGHVHGAIPSGLAAAKTLRPTGVGSIDSVNTASSLRTFALRAVSETVRA